MADQPASSPTATTAAAAAPTNTPTAPFASGDGGAAAASGAAGAAASAVDAVVPPLVQPRATGIVSKRAVIGRPAPVPTVAKEAAPATDPKAATPTASSTETKTATSATAAAPQSSAAPAAGAGGDAKATATAKGEDPKLARSWADVMDREANLVSAQKALTEAQRELTAAKAAAAAEKAEAAGILAELKTPGKRLLALKRAGVELTDVQKEYLEGVGEDPIEAARREARDTVKRLEEEKLAEIKAKAEERVKAETEKATKEIEATYKALETEFVAGANAYGNVTAFKLSKEQTLQIAAAELGHLPTPAEAKQAMEATQKFFHDRITAAGYVSKSEVDALVAAAVAKATAAPATNPAPDITPGTITSRNNTVPVVRRPSVASQTWQERLAEGKRLLGITD